jgi:hypothetical protein
VVHPGKENLEMIIAKEKMCNRKKQTDPISSISELTGFISSLPILAD